MRDCDLFACVIVNDLLSVIVNYLHCRDQDLLLSPTTQHGMTSTPDYRGKSGDGDLSSQVSSLTFSPYREDVSLIEEVWLPTLEIMGLKAVESYKVTNKMGGLSINRNKTLTYDRK